MSAIVGDSLPERALAFLQGGQSVVVSTVGADGEPWSGVMSWVYAPDPRTVRLIVAASSQTLANVRATGRMMLQLLGDGFTYGVRGAAHVLQDSIEGAPVPAAVVELRVDLVKDDLTPGRAFSARIASWWPEPARQAVEEHGLALLRALPAPKAAR